LAARRRIPRAALGLKKYLDRSGWVSKTSGNEDTTAALGDSEELSVQHSPANAIPEVSQGPDDGSHVPSVVGRQETGDVLKNEPAWAHLVGQPHDLPEQPRACASQARAASRHRDVLARETTGEDSSLWNKSGCS
jgi:predicted phage gp36 major capsid-like protein